jgi:hypothetical protein
MNEDHMGGVLAYRRRNERVKQDFDHLLSRLSRRWYPETKSVAALYWLKTVYASGYELDHWRALNKLLVRYAAPDETLKQLQCWIQQQGLLKKAKETVKTFRPLEPRNRERELTDLLPYMTRLLNEWLPREVARLLTEEPFEEDSEGIPSIAAARALERILERDRLSKSTLNRLLDPSFPTALLIYPADYELLRDVVLYLLGRTDAPPSPILPATLLYTAPDTTLAKDFGTAFQLANLAEGPEGEELNIPIELSQAEQILREDQVRITSVAVTMDGRWWKAYRLNSGDQSAVVYRPVDVLRIDGSHQHVRIRICWPEARFRWSGDVAFGRTLEIFGRQWTIERWDQDSEQTWVTLVFAGLLKPPAVEPAIPSRRPPRPASVDMAWTSLESALQLAITNKDHSVVEQLRRSELIPLARALLKLNDLIAAWRPVGKSELEQAMRGVVFQADQLASSFGRIPWRVLPANMQRGLLRPRCFRAVGGFLEHLFDGVEDSRIHAA